ncbi:MAG: hypothetical protein Q9187_007423, partial [Circinaria calcarea]
RPENASIERLGVGAQFDKCENPEWSGSIDLDFLAHTDHSEKGLLDQAVYKVPMTPYPQFKEYGVEEWIEHLPVPLRYTSMLTLHQPSFHDPAMEFSSTTEGNTQCAHGSGESEFFEGFGTQPAVFQQPRQNLHALLSPVASSQVSSSGFDEYLEGPIIKVQSSSRSAKKTSNQSPVPELDTFMNINNYDALPKVMNEKSAANWRLNFSQIQESEQLSTNPDRKRIASITPQWEMSKRSRSVGGRKGKRRQRTFIRSRHKSTSTQKFQCTWCWVAFIKKSDWRRHEESQHAPQTEWVYGMIPPLPETPFSAAQYPSGRGPFMAQERSNCGTTDFVKYVV